MPDLNKVSRYELVSPYNEISFFVQGMLETAEQYNNPEYAAKASKDMEIRQKDIESGGDLAFRIMQAVNEFDGSSTIYLLDSFKTSLDFSDEAALILERMVEDGFEKYKSLFRVIINHH